MRALPPSLPRGFPGALRRRPSAAYMAGYPRAPTLYDRQDRIRNREANLTHPPARRRRPRIPWRQAFGKAPESRRQILGIGFVKLMRQRRKRRFHSVRAVERRRGVTESERSREPPVIVLRRQISVERVGTQGQRAPLRRQTLCVKIFREPP